MHSFLLTMSYMNSCILNSCFISYMHNMYLCFICPLYVSTIPCITCLMCIQIYYFIPYVFTMYSLVWHVYSIPNIKIHSFMPNISCKFMCACKMFDFSKFMLSLFRCIIHALHVWSLSYVQLCMWFMPCVFMCFWH